MTHIGRSNDFDPAGWAEHCKLDRILDMALELTFPASDPVAVTISPNKTSNLVKARRRSVKAPALS